MYYAQNHGHKTEDNISTCSSDHEMEEGRDDTGIAEEDRGGEMKLNVPKEIVESMIHVLSTIAPPGVSVREFMNLLDEALLSSRCLDPIRLRERILNP